MHIIKIGILDEEQEYAKMLSAYLGRFGRGKWSVAAFTDRQVLGAYLEKGQLDIIAGTNREELKLLQNIHNHLFYLWLSDRPEPDRREMGFYETYRYQSAEVIGKMLERITSQMAGRTGMHKTMAAIYSPVGRCGKTTLALEIAGSDDYGRWLYIGMEDYRSFVREPGADENAEMENFFYFIKERQEEKLLRLIKGSEGIIDSGRSFFDTRQGDYEDLEWLMEVLQKCECSGILFDIGTGILTDLNILSLFDCILVPYLKGEISMAKRNNFEQMLALHGYEFLQEKMVFINMSNQDEVEEQKQAIFGGEKN